MSEVKSKILSIEEQIQKLKAQQKKEKAKLESNVGKKFLDIFEAHNKPTQEIYQFIEDLKANYDISKSKNSELQTVE